MTTRRLRIISLALAPWLASASLFAAPLGQITPPPCSADGSCVPARTTWGYHKTQWRLWPGTSVETRTADDTRSARGSELGATAKPDPTREDKLAPPKVDALDPDSGDSEPEAEFELPELRDFAPPAREPAENDSNRFEPPRPGFLDRPLGAPADAPSGEAAPDRPAPRIPFGQPPAAPERAVTPPDDLFPYNQPSVRPYGDDVPPPLPFVQSPGKFSPAKSAPTPRQRVAPSHVLQASATLATQRDTRVAAISAQLPSRRPQTHAAQPQATQLRKGKADAPPALPAVWIEGR